MLTVNVDAVRVLGFLRNGDKRIAYAIANAINKTAKDVQKAEFAHAKRVFKIRKGDFILRQVAIIKPFASPTTRSFVATVSVGKKPRLQLSGMEEGDIRTPAKGRRAAVPIIGGVARPSFAAGVPETFQYRALKLKRVGGGGRKRTDVTVRTTSTRSGAKQYKGEHRTFMLPSTNKAPHGGVFQRTGPGRDDVRMVYSFVPPGRLPKLLGFNVTAKREIQRVFAAYLRAEIKSTLEHAR